MNERIFVIEDDENIQEIVKLSLESNGYQVILFDNAIDAIAAFHEFAPDLAIFDVMLPQMDGITAVKKIRETNTQVPILILSAKDTEIDKIHGLDSGSDDYMTKPFGVLELCARVRTLLRRVQPKSKQIKTPSLTIDKSTHVVTHFDQIMDLTHKEYQLLLYLIENKQRVVERDELLNNIWGYDFIGESRALDVHIRSLRKKLDDDGEKYIKTIRSVGYRFVEKEDSHD
ncbi:MAG: response regulator transcription factor [Coprobacillus cateniformis]|uniref:Two-component system alkaline phosphatase synthesis response regulator PhoP n=1 Tax=Longibaculum muris TaxID=1796628 RepID=A0A4R3YZ03_9FIRM|nr:response regulator transcription factor [Longibaculum muris]KXU42521.1 putative alkaline phosphatase synthesis transcriptional regulatory protein PhoP [Candidatus Stoquefichus sp. KLE1796]MBS5112755.1 response regulator transcription factor [Coprobacillus cateniformis]MBS5368484.1 response regulator transcription factor [Coprobacillus cateniformis]MCR1887922.1 response regulator transcription factor [Longibaculum muris]MED9812913.1 response regulator transcription factor [Longibaculum muris